MLNIVHVVQLLGEALHGAVHPVLGYEQGELVARPAAARVPRQHLRGIQDRLDGRHGPLQIVRAPASHEAGTYTA